MYLRRKTRKLKYLSPLTRTGLAIRMVEVLTLLLPLDLALLKLKIKSKYRQKWLNLLERSITIRILQALMVLRSQQILRRRKKFKLTKLS